LTPHDQKRFAALGHNPNRLVSPIIVAIVGADGLGTSTRIEITAARATVQ
jgi:hypothetical protein